MNAMRAKLKSSRGETLVEVLASILIATLSVALLLGGVAVSVNLGRQADAADDSFYAILTAAESRTGVPASGTITIVEGGTSISIPVWAYGGEGLWSYALDTAAGGGGP